MITLINDVLRKIPYPNKLPKMLNIGLTGGIGSGKSTVARLLQAKGAALIDMDAIARELTKPNGLAMPEIKTIFGQQMLTADGALDRARMRALVFDDALAKKQLEQITHPLIYQQAVRIAHELSLQAPVPLCLLYDIPLLYGSNVWLELLDCVVVVTCTREEQIHRVLKRAPTLDRALVESMIDAQASAEQLAEIADVLIDNGQNEPHHLQLETRVNILYVHICYLMKLKSEI